MQIFAYSAYVGLAATFLFAGPVRAFTLLGDTAEIKGWDTKTLNFHINPENCPTSVTAILDQALKVWNETPTSGITLARGSDTNVSVAAALAGQADVSPTVHCVTDMAALQMDPNTIPGAATGQRWNADGHLTYGVLLLNAESGAADNISNLPDAVVTDVIAHEIGHILGLGHSSDHNALMYYDGSKRTQASLAQDDVDAISYLYPRDELGGNQPFGGCGVVGGLNSSAANSLLFTALLPLAVAILNPLRALASVRLRGRSHRQAKQDQ
jgi:hypothetical protein